jgi:hypothetical protein
MGLSAPTTTRLSFENTEMASSVSASEGGEAAPDAETETQPSMVSGGW